MLNTALESVFYDEDQGYQLINMLLEEEEEEKQEDDIEQKDQIEVENGENYEKDEIDENGEGYEEECKDKSNVEDGVSSRRIMQGNLLQQCFFFRLRMTLLLLILTTPLLTLLSMLTMSLILKLKNLKRQNEF